MLGWRAAAEVLLLQQPLVDVLVKHALRRLRQWGPATPCPNSTLLLWPLSWSTLPRLKWRSSWSHRAANGPTILPTYRILLLLLLHLHLMLEPLLQRCSDL